MSLILCSVWLWPLSTTSRGSFCPIFLNFFFSCYFILSFLHGLLSLTAICVYQNQTPYVVYHHSGLKNRLTGRVADYECPSGPHTLLKILRLRISMCWEIIRLLDSRMLWLLLAHRARDVNGALTMCCRQAKPSHHRANRP